MRKVFFISFLFVAGLLPALASANTMEYLVDEQIFSGDFATAKDVHADLHFNQNGNDFGGKIFFQDLKTIPLIQLEIAGDGQKECSEQVRGFYINSARGNRVRPLDEDSLVYLQSIDSSYNTLIFTGGFFVCSGLTNSVVGSIQHIWKGESYSLVAGLAYNFFSNDYLPSFQTGGNFLFENGTTTGYLRDSYGGIAQIFGSGLHISGTVVTPPSGGGGGGGGGGGSLSKDICPDNRDCSASFYDGGCGICPIITTGAITTGIIILPGIVDIATTSGDITGSPYSAELNQAYQRAYSMGITTKPTIQQANLNGRVLRKYMAKMMSQFAMNVLGRVVDDSVGCYFTDISAESSEVRYYARTACKLGIMGLFSDGTPNTKFNPNGELTRAQFGTMLSRVLYGDKYNSTSAVNRYFDHLQALKEAGIMTKITVPLTRMELRGYVMLMLMRTQELPALSP